MILVDTSVWVEHLRRASRELSDLLLTQQVLMHPFVRGELACGNLRNRVELIQLFNALPLAAVATDDEVMFYIEKHRLMGKGIGFVDAHLLAATRLTPDAKLWTKDKSLAVLASQQRLDHVSSRQGSS